MPEKVVKVRVTPGARTEEIEEGLDGALKVRVRPKAEQGKANERVLEMLAEHFGVAKSKVTLFRGASSREKLIRIEID